MAGAGNQPPRRRPVAHLLHGFIGSGKTTFARRLAQDSGARRFSADERMIARYGRNPPAADFQRRYGQLHDALWEEALALLREGSDVILDLGFWSRARRDDARARVHAAGAEARFYALTCSVAEMRLRTLARTAAQAPDALHIDGPAFDTLLAGFEPMTAAESHTRVDTSSADAAQ